MAECFSPDNNEITNCIPKDMFDENGNFKNESNNSENKTREEYSKGPTTKFIPKVTTVKYDIMTTTKKTSNKKNGIFDKSQIKEYYDLDQIGRCLIKVGLIRQCESQTEEKPTNKTYDKFIRDEKIAEKRMQKHIDENPEEDMLINTNPTKGNLL